MPVNRLKDAAAFNRQANLGLSEAVVTATEGLKNENSVLVDNAGVTKNVAKMWDEYAKSIGTTRDKLTESQKVQAEYTGILKETEAQVGNAEKAAKGPTGSQAELDAKSNELKVTVGTPIAIRWPCSKCNSRSWRWNRRIATAWRSLAGSKHWSPRTTGPACSAASSPVGAVVSTAS